MRISLSSGSLLSDAGDLHRDAVAGRVVVRARRAEHGVDVRADHDDRGRVPVGSPTALRRPTTTARVRLPQLLVTSLSVTFFWPAQGVGAGVAVRVDAGHSAS